MKEFEYMKFPIKIIPQEIIDKYKLEDIVHKGYVYIKIWKGMYGLPQAGWIANDLLKEQLATFSYAPCKYTPGLWRHHTKDIVFTLVVDDFGCKYKNEKDFEELVDTLNKFYATTTDLSSKLYLGMTLDWD